MDLLDSLSVAELVSCISGLGILFGLGGGIFKILQRHRAMEQRLERLDELHKMMCRSLFAVLDAMTGGEDGAVLKVKEELREHLIDHS